MTIIRKRVPSLSETLDADLFQAQPAGDLYSDLARRIGAGNLVPVISCSIAFESLFRLDAAAEPPGSAPPLAGGATEEDAGPPLVYTLENELSISWANLIHYPLPDRHDLARVAQYHRTQSEDDDAAKFAYLSFLRRSLLAVARHKGVDPDVVAELLPQLDAFSLTDLCRELDYPPRPDGPPGPLTILARLPLPLYITTSYHDFIERELEAAGRSYVTQICFWSSRPVKIAPQHRTLPDLELDPARPVVYHLYGLENYPASIAISEDDYLDFLSSVLTDTDAGDPVIPLYLRQALSNSATVLLGYRLQDWDFRALFRGVILPRQSTNRMRNLIIQLTPEEQYHMSSALKARDYLKTYFDPKNFDVEWGNPGNFLHQVWDAWERRRR